MQIRSSFPHYFSYFAILFAYYLCAAAAAAGWEGSDDVTSLSS